MKDRVLEKMELDELWNLHQRIIDVLDRKLENQKRKLEDQLDELGRRFGGSPKDIPQRRPYPRSSRNFETRMTPQRRGQAAAKPRAG